MKIESKSTENHEATFEVSVSAEEFQPYKQQAARKMASQTKIPGFRPGKAPYDIVQRLYGGEAIAQEALDLYLEKEYSRLIDEAEIEPGGMGNLTKVDAFDPPVFTVRIPLAPTVDLGEYREIREDFEEAAVADDEVQEMIEKLRDQNATTEPTDSAAENGDHVSVMIKGDYKEIDPDTGKTGFIAETPQDFVIGQDAENGGWLIAGFTKNLLGVKAGDVVTTEHTYSEKDAPVESLAGREVIFTTTVQSVKRSVKPEVDAEFIKNFGEYETVEAFTDFVREQILHTKQAEAQNAYIEKLTDKLVEGAKIEYAPATLEAEAQSMLDNLKKRLARDGIDFELYCKLSKSDPETFVEEKLQPDAERQLKRRLAIQEFARIEKIKLDFEKFKTLLGQVQSEASAEYARIKPKKEKDAFLSGLTDMAMNQAFSDAIFDRLIAIGKGENPEIEPAAPATESVVEGSASPSVSVDSNEVLDTGAEI